MEYKYVEVYRASDNMLIDYYAPKNDQINKINKRIRKSLKQMTLGDQGIKQKKISEQDELTLQFQNLNPNME